ncbi:MULTISPECIES: sirohydrochlorin chelatase [Cyanophyceae]|uniref:sirohydrochlorin chelatase n=1 Tax=Cyanophyceae TaxID=3028117 RepID=UPI00016DC6C4|nr:MULTISPECIES: sirohydrochlorin chelatase [Cyanophyceae]ACA98128.1 CbiX-like protein [Picosynechococcus sp. PCC 7002]SMH43486.1 Sirohydrochlorin ferrochelatase [Picosynechococcus sp. OG1]SMQ79453.1 Sirohydrochlorin ferrochelatase [Synechococcus sp. 7002]
MQRLSVVVVHGSFSDSYRREFQTLMTQVKAQVDHPVLGAYLECSEVSLTAAIAQFLRDHAPEPAEVQILPLFLLPGVHVREDLPEAIAQLQAQFPQVKFQQLDYLGKDARLAPFLERQFAENSTAQRILIAHGSRRTGANPEIEKLAQALNASTAYWATEPSLDQKLAQLQETTATTIHLVPYFLFSGKIPKAIAAQVSTFSQTNPDITVYLGQPFGTDPQCAAAIAQILQSGS